MNTHTNNQNQNVNLDVPQNLLIVDDEPGILQAMQRSFRRSNFHVFTAGSAEEGLALLEKETIQVVLSDFRMPQMSGGELVRAIKQRHPDVVSMIISGYADFDSAVEVLNSGAAIKFLRKPWNNQSLLQEVDEAFDVYPATQGDPLGGAYQSRRDEQGKSLVRVCAGFVAGGKVVVRGGVASFT